jgi:hypothetical protein
MNHDVHTLACHVVSVPQHADRFYMDMRIYRLQFLPLEGADPEPGDVIWRGIYLAIEVEACQESRPRHRA